MESKSHRLLLVLIVFVLAIGLYRNFGERCTLPRLTRHSASFAGKVDREPSHVDLGPANATLGVQLQRCSSLWSSLIFVCFQFGRILAVSRQHSPRREGLLLAANITDLDISIPVQPIWTDEDVLNLRAEQGSSITRGSALAWLGHLNALRTFLASDCSTALILEDDVDWDFRLRTSQIPITASAFRSLTSNFNVEGLGRSDYWGNTTIWDVCECKACILI